MRYDGRSTANPKPWQMRNGSSTEAEAADRERLILANRHRRTAAPKPATILDRPVNTDHASPGNVVTLWSSSRVHSGVEQVCFCKSALMKPLRSTCSFGQT